MTDQPQLTQADPVFDGPTPPPAQPNTVLGEPATVENCRRDYDEGTADRLASQKKDRP